MNNLKILKARKIELEKEFDTLEKIESIILRIIGYAEGLDRGNNIVHKITILETLCNEFKFENHRAGLESMEHIFQSNLFEGIMNRRNELNNKIKELENENE